MRGSHSAPSTPRPKWGTLWVLVAIMMGALAVVETGLAPGFTETLLECGLVLGGFGTMAVWTRRNRVALDCQDWCECASTQVTMRLIPSRPPESAVSKSMKQPAWRRTRVSPTVFRARSQRASLRRSARTT